MSKELPAVIKGDTERCPYCNTKIADLIEGLAEVALVEWDGSIVERKRLEAGQRLPYLLPGYSLNQEEEADLWELTPHARNKYERTGAPGHRYRGQRMAPADYPARVRCFRCGDVCRVDKV